MRTKQAPLRQPERDPGAAWPAKATRSSVFGSAPPRSTEPSHGPPAHVFTNALYMSAPFSARGQEQGKISLVIRVKSGRMNDGRLHRLLFPSQHLESACGINLPGSRRARQHRGVCVCTHGTHCVRPHHEYR